MAIFLDRIDASPISYINEFNFQFLQWIWVLVDVLNENMNTVQTALTLLTATGYTQTEITDMDSAGQLSDGVILYDNTNNVYVGRENGSLVKFTTTSYP